MDYLQEGRIEKELADIESKLETLYDFVDSPSCSHKDKKIFESRIQILEQRYDLCQKDLTEIHLSS